MAGPLLVLFVILFVPFALVAYNRQRVRGKMLCFFVREDKSVLAKLCTLRDDWVIFENRAFDVYPDFVRLTRFPMGWPPVLQELVPTTLYDEEDAIPLDWVKLGNRLERSMELRAALDENWLRKLVEETAREGGAPRFNIRKYLPHMLVVVGVIGLIYVLVA